MDNILDEIITGNQQTNTPGGSEIISVKPTEKHAWESIRRTFILGEKHSLKDGTVVNKDYSLAEVARLFNVNYGTLKSRAKREGWSRSRAAYLSRVSPNNLGNDLGYYDEESSTAEARAFAASNKLGTVLDKYINHRYGEILECDDIYNLDESVQRRLAEVNTNTGRPVFISELKEAIEVASNIYKLHRTILSDAPQDTGFTQAYIDGDDPAQMTPEQRQKALEEIQRRVGLKLSKPNSSIDADTLATD